MPVPTSFADYRAALKLARAGTATALYARTIAQQNLDAALRLGDAGAIAAAQSAFDTADSDLKTARTMTEANARSTLNQAIVGWLSDTSSPPNPLGVDADLARLDAAGVPIALFPVRLETRFDAPNTTLHIRIYPDEFFSDIHERELTPAESAAGTDYWTAVANNGGQETADLWAPVAKRYGVPRAAYIVRVTNQNDPANKTPPAPRATVPSRGAEAVLPDRWVAVGYRGGNQQFAVMGAPIPEPINLTPNPSADDQTLVEVADGFQVPSNILWTMQYADARSKGMAIDVTTLSSDDLKFGFDRIVVFGVKTSMDPTSSAQLISDLFDAHHYTRGLDLVPLGTPTNNIPGQPTPFTMKDPPPEVSFQIERVGPSLEEGFPRSDFIVLSQLFGFDFDPGPFTFLAGSLNFQQDIITGQFMRSLLWPATLGYFMRQMMNPPTFLTSGGTPIFSEATFTNAKKFFHDYVYAQGPAPAFRVGAVPYGLLPAISYSRMQAGSGESNDFIQVIQNLVPFWQQATATVPVVPGASGDRNKDLMAVLSQKSSADTVYVRNSIGPDTITNLYQFLLQDFAAYLTALTGVPSATLGALGHTDWSGARIFQLMFSSQISQFAGPLVTAHPMQGMLVSAVNPKLPEDEGDPTTFNYLQYLADSTLSLQLVQTQGAMPNAAPAGELTPLLYLLARHSLLLEMLEIGQSSQSPVLLPVFPQKMKPFDFELWGIIAGQADQQTFWEALQTTSGGHSIFDIIKLNNDFTGKGPGVDSLGRYETIANSAGNLSGLPVAELERVFTETLDLGAHRLDAFVTALATRRLTNYRGVTTVNQASDPTGTQTYLGGYGVVENLRPAPTPQTRTVDGLVANIQGDNGGYIHAPSPRHATAAAILRSGRMAEKSDPTKYAIELPSDRARRARLLVDGVRDGLPLGELLGFQLESSLRSSGAPQPEAIVLALRKLYPLVANKSGLDPGVPADGIAAANVVDGQLVRQAAATNSIPFGTNGVPANGQAAVTAAVKDLNATVDAIADLETSEAIFQVATGDVASAQAAMNFLPDGSNPPQSEVTTSPTSGIPVSHRVALVLEGDTPTATGWMPGARPAERPTRSAPSPTGGSAACSGSESGDGLAVVPARRPIAAAPAFAVSANPGDRTARFPGAGPEHLGVRSGLAARSPAGGGGAGRQIPRRPTSSSPATTRRPRDGASRSSSSWRARWGRCSGARASLRRRIWSSRPTTSRTVSSTSLPAR